jgi:chorismate mutase
VSLRGIRGATTADRNDPESIVDATAELLRELAQSNELDVEEVAFAYFSTTSDLNAEFPALAARRIGWVDVPMLCGHEMEVAGPNPRAVPRCIRVLLLYNTERRQREMRHVYLRGASAIKKDLDRMRSRLGALTPASAAEEIKT